MLFYSILPLLFLSLVLGGQPPQGLQTRGLKVAETKAHANRDVKNKYIVVLEDDTEVERLIGGLSNTIRNAISHRYSRALKGFSGTFGASELSALRALAVVKYIEEDVMAYASVEQSNSTYGLAITSQKRVLPSQKQTTYFYKPAKGSATAYVIDSGIDTSHPEFGGRASWGPDFTGEGAYDSVGHGTHVAGTIGSKSYGVFKQAKLVAVKVLNSYNSGSVSAIIAGIDWVIMNKKGPSVINMSLGTSIVHKALNEATRAAYKAGITVVVAAGNGGNMGFTACEGSPSSEPLAITVGAINRSYKTAYFSSQDSCVDIHGPGVDVLSTWPGNDTMIEDGTSMSTPHVTGVAAYLISQFGLTKPEQVFNTILKYAQKGVVKDTRGAPNVLANNGFFLS